MDLVVVHGEFFGCLATEGGGGGGGGGRGRSPLRKLCNNNSFCHFLAYSGHNLQRTTPE